MTLTEKLQKFIDKRKVEIEKGRSKLEEDKARRQKAKAKKLANMKPGAHKAISEGLALRKGPIQVMKEEAARRKYEREKKRK